MLRHSLNYFLAQLAAEKPMRFSKEILVKAIQYLNSLDFHKRLRIGFYYWFQQKFKHVLNRQSKLIKIIQRKELIMIPIPKPKSFERKIPVGQSLKDYLTEISERQTHILRDAIDRVSFIDLQ